MSDIVLLIAPFFDELTTIALVTELRQQGIRVTVIGLIAGLIVGRHGVSIKPEKTLSTWTDWDHGNTGVILSGEERCGTTLLSDPRVHLLVKNIVLRGGFVAVNTTVLKIMLDLAMEIPEKAVCHLPSYPETCLPLTNTLRQFFKS